VIADFTRDLPTPRSNVRTIWAADLSGSPPVFLPFDANSGREFAMKMLIFGLPILTISAGLIIASYGQQADNRRGGPPPEWNPVHLFPPDVRESLNLSAEQDKQIEELEKEVRGKVDKILTAQQRRILSQARPRGPGGPDGPPDGPGRRPGRNGQRPGGPGEPPPPPRGGPDGDAAPPPPPGPPSGPREWEEAAESLNLSGAQRDKTDDVIDQMREKLHKQHAEAHADLVRQLKVVLNPEQFQKFEKALEDAAPR
jgi:Spy/CpxP family protein refolding chaperone